LSTTVLKEELKEFGLPVDGEWDDLERILVQHVFTNPSEYSGESDLPETVNVTIESNKPPMLDAVRKWNLKFCPEDSVHTFLERLGELKLALGVSDENMLKTITEILRSTGITQIFGIRGKNLSLPLKLDTFR
jgi:threonine synthase